MTLPFNSNPFVLEQVWEKGAARLPTALTVVREGRQSPYDEIPIRLREIGMTSLKLELRL
ncbi:hypothetical protein [Echinicola sp. 20G]|uniref:hypothetical protein n=1 Tax=Echinicola sp. 20G TaxID=2781961 RepID=UPI001910B246|nr:hypothetical protein [Echinicola sp. 20G]